MLDGLQSNKFIVVTYTLNNWIATAYGKQQNTAKVAGTY